MHYNTIVCKSLPPTQWRQNTLIAHKCHSNIHRRQLHLLVLNWLSLFSISQYSQFSSCTGIFLSCTGIFLSCTGISKIYLKCQHYLTDMPHPSLHENVTIVLVHLPKSPSISHPENYTVMMVTSKSQWFSVQDAHFSSISTGSVSTDKNWNIGIGSIHLL